MTDLKVVLTDGSIHPVDSDQLSFELAAHAAFKNVVSEGRFLCSWSLS
jgi:elongation factor G